MPPKAVPGAGAPPNMVPASHYNATQRPPQKKNLFFRTYDAWVAVNRPNWKTAERNRTRDFIWWDNFLFRQPFETAWTANNGVVPPWDSNVVPVNPRALAEKNNAHARFNSRRQTRTNPTGAVPVNPPPNVGPVQNAPPSPLPPLPLPPRHNPAQPAVPIAPPIAGPAPARPAAVVAPSIVNRPDPAPARPAAVVAPPIVNRPDSAPARPTEAKSPYKDQYPFYYPFMPPPPWDEDPDSTELRPPPHLSKRKWEEEQRGDRYILQNIERVTRRWLRTALGKLDEEESTWQGSRFLGSGTYGSTGLWVKTDAQKNIIQSMVAKEATPSLASWIQPSEWRQQRPREITMHVILDNARDEDTNPFPNIIQHYGYRLMMRHRRFRLYLEYCSRGNLAHALRDRTTVGWKNGQRHEDYKDAPPECFIWYVLAELVEACIILEQGNANHLRENWQPLVHADFHNANVFLKPRESSSNGIPKSWPHIILADYGRMFYEINTDPSAPFEERDNPHEYVFNSDFDGYNNYPSELGFSTHKTRITGKTDVFSIGAIAWQMMAGKFDRDVPILAGGRAPAKEAIPKEVIEKDPNLRGYSRQLRKLIAHCLQFTPADRPGILAMREAIRRVQNDPNHPGSQRVEIRMAYDRNMGGDPLANPPGH
ncbi:hypothetical protein P280DRAFT_515081 [Massarina eburnea CBS 473.64]|uniref:Protein kinase domain-containing protein n=1 Tax=Massarina eburnea CBS 473.64 TaxID=1395130 RepID=A0A6A6SBI0_9PLEO|nr:hypothetical protein P280DRAFT_515081 [Massarina eburnea CBS 473.64]